MRATVFVDATAGVFLARAAGGATRLGPSRAALYGEPGAPDEHPLAPPEQRQPVLPRAPASGPREPRQGIGARQAPPEGIDPETIRTATSIRTYPNGDLNLNPVGLMLG